MDSSNLSKENIVSQKYENKNDSKIPKMNSKDTTKREDSSL